MDQADRIIIGISIIMDNTKTKKTKNGECEKLRLRTAHSKGHLRVHKDKLIKR